MNEEFNLSEKIILAVTSEYTDSDEVVRKEDVKEFIRLEDELIRLMENIKITFSEFIRRRDELIGKELLE